MPGPWEKYQQQQSGPWDRYQQPAYTGSILPFSRDEQGNVSFDPSAGLLGAFTRAVTLPGDVFTGQVDPLSEEGIERSFELGAMAGPTGTAIRAGDRAIPGVSRAMRKEQPPVPTAEELRAAGSAGYDRAREMGVEYSSDAVKELATTLRGQLERDGILADLAPKTFKRLDDLANPPEDSVITLSGIEAARRALQNAARDFNNPTEQKAAQRVLSGLDEFVEMGDPATVVAGPARDAASTVRAARGNYAAAKRSEKLRGAPDSIEERAGLSAAVANSGQNIDNTLRQAIRSLLQNKKQRAGFSKGELALLEKAARGEGGRQLLRWAGNAMGGGGGRAATMAGAAGFGAGGFLGGPLGAIVGGIATPAAGAAMRGGANALSRRALRKVDEAVRQRSPAYEQRLADMPSGPISPERRAALIRALLLSGGGGQQDAQPVPFGLGVPY